MLLHEKLKTRRLILASTSPRRRELLEGLGLPFTLATKFECEEIYPTTTPADQVPIFLSTLKSDAYPTPLEPNDILLTADTVVLVGDQILGKPTDRDDARTMLCKLSGATHIVVTGVTLRSAEKSKSFSTTSHVKFAPISIEQIDYYLDNFRPYDKAGSYGIQEWIGYTAIESVSGSFYNVMGLPTHRIYTELDKFID